MKRCLMCDEQHGYLLHDCPKCGVAPALEGGFYAYAPGMAVDGEGFKSRYFAELATIEDSNFWFRFRNELIIWALKKYCPDFGSFFEVGCGTGYVLSGIANAFPNVSLLGSEIFTEGLTFAADRLPSANLMQMDARNIPFVNEFDVMGAFDVLEHIQDDKLVLAQMHAALKPQGIVLITVPQHEWLWSSVDENACHFRRYTSSDLHEKVKSAGFQILRSTSFVTTLLPAMMLSRLLRNRGSNDKSKDSAELAISPTLNSIFLKCLHVELYCIRLGFNFPVGGSRFIVVRKT